VGYLRHPSWQNWDFTLARRIPVAIGRGASLRVQIQLYNMWNQVQFRTMNASYTFNSVRGKHQREHRQLFTDTHQPVLTAA
jgi:hypothetical protein